MTTDQMSFEEKSYEYGFITDIESEVFPKGLNEEIITRLSQKKNEPPFMLKFRLEAYRTWLTMTAPTWANVQYNPIDFQNIRYYAAPKVPQMINFFQFQSFHFP